MRDCCRAPSGYEELFSEKQARRDLRRYRAKGLDGAARWIVEAVRRQGVEGMSVLEPGGGVGAVEIELLRAGAGSSTVVELSAAYDEAAGELAREAGFEGRVERRVGDFAADGSEAADVVVLHRVVCCYPDYERLLAAAATKARRTVVYTYPPRNPVSRAAVALLNLWPRLKRSEFRAFVHPPRAMEDVVRRQGFDVVDRRRGIWYGLALRRPTAE